jgi:GNAT superfamily N-acetyltransferase
MLQDLVAEVLYGRLGVDFPEYQLLALDEAGELVGRVNTVPFVWTGEDDDLPDLGWDGVLQRGFRDRRLGERPTAVSLLEARVVPDRQGRGLSAALLQAARAAVHDLGHTDLFGPVRPTEKHREPRTPMGEYVARTRDDGLPEDPWLRVHVRLGARVVRVCPVSMTIPGTLAEWREWTGLPLDRSGPAEVPGALVPVHVSVEHDVAVYVEPNVWVHHRL